MKVNVIDSLMGTGKTTSAINFINSSNSNTRFLYITPYLTEVERIIESCPTKSFKEPKVFGTKLNGIKSLFQNKQNIVSTHALFRYFDAEIIDLAYEYNYVLIMDEVADVVEPLIITSSDLKIILEKYTTIEDGHILRWIDSSYSGRFDDYKRLCDLGCVGIYNNNVVLWLFPIGVFKCFKEIFILTYLFKGQLQKSYFDYYNVEYNYMYVKGDGVTNYQFDVIESNITKCNYKELINICNSDKLNSIGYLDGSLSKGWYERNKDNGILKHLKNNTYNYFKYNTKTKSSDNLWTTFRDYKEIISDKGYAKGFLSFNTRATNDYKHKTSIAYLVNRYFNPYIKNFFVQNKIGINEDLYALSELLQFVWRSAIREHKPINIYIPSLRMRTLLINWIDEQNSL